MAVNSKVNPFVVVGACTLVNTFPYKCWSVLHLIRLWFEPEKGENWRVLEGASEGQTQLDVPQVGDVSHWNHPLDIHLATRGLSGWPHIQLQVYDLDSYSRIHLIGYATAAIPTRPGFHSIRVPAWRPLGQYFQFNYRSVTCGNNWNVEGSFTEELSRYFVGGGIELADSKVGGGGAADRLHLRTVTAGSIHLELGLIFRDFKKFGIEYWDQSWPSSFASFHSFSSERTEFPARSRPHLRSRRKQLWSRLLRLLQVIETSLIKFLWSKPSLTELSNYSNYITRILELSNSWRF